MNMEKVFLLNQNLGLSKFVFVFDKNWSQLEVK